MKTLAEIIDEIKSIISVDFKDKKVFDKDVANVLGIPAVNFATMKKRNRIPFNELLDFCAKKSISINWLLYGQSPESLIDATNRFYKIKYFEDINVSAGGGADVLEEDSIPLQIPEELVGFLGQRHELKYIEAINVSGDSMEPTFSYNDIVFINRSQTSINRGGIFVLKTEAGLFIKRVKKRTDGQIEIISDNSIYSKEILNSNEVDIIGRVVCRFGNVD